MSADCYAESIRRLLINEGGYVNHPSDPGGPTNFGVTLRDYRRYVRAGATADDLRGMKVEDAKAIYREKYWNAMCGDMLPAGVDYCVFDYAVNSGTSRAPKVLQRILGVPVTGCIDETTLAATRERDARTVVQAMCDERLRFLQALKTWPVFGRGWSKRVGEVRAAALAMADKAAGRAPIGGAPSSRAPGKGVVPVNDAARKGTAGGAIATGGAIAQQSAANGAEWMAFLLIIVVTLAIAAGSWAFWHWRQQRQQEAPA
jgi:lysozyme family protein